MTDMLTIPRSSSRDRVEKYFRRKIADVEVGEPLPSVRRTMRDCGVSQVTVQTVVDRLREQGVIEVQPRRGFFKSGEAGSFAGGSRFKVNQLNLIYFGLSRQENKPLSSDFHADLFSQFGRICGERDWSLRLHELSADAQYQDLYQVLNENECNACIVVSNPVNESDELFNQRDISFVNLFPRNETIPDHSIVIDPVEMVNKQVDHLLALGHRKIAYLHTVEPNRFHRDMILRREQFYKYIAENSLPLEPHWVQYGGYDADTTISAIEQVMQGGNKPTALIMGDTRLSVAYYKLRTMGFTVGEDFSIIGTDDLSIAASQHPPATTVRVPRRRAVQLAFATLDQVLMGEMPEQPVTLPLDLIVRASTARCNNLDHT